MSERPLYVSFKPRWARNGTSRFRATEETANTGLSPLPAPRLPTRIIPRGNRLSISASTLIDSVYTTQKLLLYASYDCVNGPDPAFSDLRRAEQSVMELGRMSIEPFEPGSFIIPAELADVSVTAKAGAEKSIVSSQDVLERFIKIMEAVFQNDEEAKVSQGALKEIGELSKILDREAESLEYLPDGLPNSRTAPPRIVVNSDYIERAASFALNRQKRVSKAAYLTGRIVALDVSGKRRLKLHMLDRDLIVEGRFPIYLDDHMAKHFGKVVQVHGIVTYHSEKPVKVEVSSLTEVAG